MTKARSLAEHRLHPQLARRVISVWALLKVNLFAERPAEWLGKTDE